MNIYVVVEGTSCERKIFKQWIPYINNSLTYVDTLNYIVSGHFSILSGRGYPEYLKKIDLAISDVNTHGGIDRIVVCVDSENQSYKEKYDEIDTIFQNNPCSATKYIVVQHFCFETWALGNSKVFPKRNPSDLILRDYISTYSVLTQDPEDLPAYPSEELNRSQFAYRYLKKILSHRRIRYTKRNPNHVKDQAYLNEIESRCNTTTHIKSFAHFLSAFI